VAFVSLLCGVAVVWAQSTLGTAENFAVLGGSAVTNTGPSVITGDLGVHPSASVTGFPPGTVTGTIHAANATALQAKNDLVTQYNALAAAPCTADLTGVDLGTVGPLTPGVYCFSSSAQLTGTLTLASGADPNATFIFKIGSTLTTASGSSVIVTGSGNDCGVAWQIGTDATLGTTTSFVGNLIALQSITLNTGANISGRALARNGAVTLDTNNISFAACGGLGVPPDIPPPAPVPTLATWAMITLLGLLALAGFAMLRRRQFLTREFPGV
jgi:type VI secretion system secreted protein VgrG